MFYTLTFFYLENPFLEVLLGIPFTPTVGRCGGGVWDPERGVPAGLHRGNHQTTERLDHRRGEGIDGCHGNTTDTFRRQVCNENFREIDTEEFKNAIARQRNQFPAHMKWVCMVGGVLIARMLRC